MIRPRNSCLALACALMCGFAPHALAERADRTKPIHLEADRVTLDDAKQMAVFSGNVVMTQGTLSVSCQQFVATQGKDGFEHGTATGAPAKFRQKRDGSDEYVEGSGERIEYDAATGVMDIYGQAHVRRGRDDARGDHIAYNAHDLSFKVSGASEQEGKRAVFIIGPRTPAASAPPAVPPPGASQPAESLPIRRDDRLINEDEKQ